MQRITSARFEFITFLLTAVVMSALWWGALDTRPLARPDEARYAEIPREMALTHDYVTPRLNGIPYFEKPPLQYWMTALAYEALGPSERTARLWTTFCGFLTLIFTAWIARTLGGGRATQWLAPIILASALYPALLGHINTLDSSVTAFLTGAIAAYLHAQGSTKHSKIAMAGAGVFLGLAILSKGLIGLVLPGIAMVLYSLIFLNFSAWKRAHLALTTFCMLLIAAPWFVLCSLQNPEFAHFFFIHEHFERFTSTVHQRVEPPWYFLPILIVGLLPWTFMLPHALYSAWRHSKSTSFAFRPSRFVLIYALGVLVFFSASGSKLPTYILPAFPAFAALIALRLTSLSGSTPRYAIGLGCLMLGGLFLTAALLLGMPTLSLQWGIALDLDPDMVQPYAVFAPWLAVGGGALLLASLLHFLLPSSFRGLSYCIVGLAGLITAVSGLHGATALSAFNSASPWVNTWRAQVGEHARLFSIQTYDQSLDFYLKRTVTLVNFEDEMGFGLKQEPERAIPHLEDFLKTWGTQPGDIAIFEPNQFQTLQAAGMRMHVLAQDSRHMVVSYK